MDDCPFLVFLELKELTLYIIHEFMIIVKDYISYFIHNCNYVYKYY
jgi:hypothetical protein